LNGPPLSVVHIVGRLDVGGLERFTIDLARAQKELSWRTAVFCLFERGELAGEAEAAGIPVVAFHKRPGFSWGILKSVAGELKRCGSTVVHTHNPGIHHYGAVAACMAGVRAVVNTRHGVKSHLGTAYKETLFRAVMPLTGKVVFVSEDTQRFHEARGTVPARKALTIRNGIALDPFLTAPAKPGSRRPSFRFGTVGRLEPVKAHDVLMEAFAVVVNEVPESRLAILGDGSLRPRLAEQAMQLGLTKAVEFRGMESNVAGFLSTLDVFVLSSHTEGLPLVILEALAAGLPIVSTRVGGVPEAAPEGEVAWYCAPGGAGALAQVMLAAARSTDLDRRSEAARRLAQSKFDIRQACAAYESVYRKLLAGDTR